MFVFVQHAVSASRPLVPITVAHASRALVPINVAHATGLPVSHHHYP